MFYSTLPLNRSVTQSSLCQVTGPLLTAFRSAFIYFTVSNPHNTLITPTVSLWPHPLLQVPSSEHLPSDVLLICYLNRLKMLLYYFNTLFYNSSLILYIKIIYNLKIFVQYKKTKQINECSPQQPPTPHHHPLPTLTTPTIIANPPPPIGTTNHHQNNPAPPKYKHSPPPPPTSTTYHHRPQVLPTTTNNNPPAITIAQYYLKKNPQNQHKTSNKK